jgi:molybdate/tungstate transport system substrate-binding protein
MLKSRRWLIAASTCLLAAGIAPAKADGKITVVYAGSMGVVMDRGLGPAFTASTGTQFQGMGQAAMALAHLLAGKSLAADVFVSVSAAPIKIVEAAGLTPSAVPVASTSIVLTYSPASKFGPAFEAAAKSGDWAKILTSPGFRFGRTDPAVDPQGQYVLYTLQLAGKYYKLPGYAAQVAGATHNPAQLFAEPSLLARLQEGQIDATLGYESAAISQHNLPFITLPDEINFSTPAFDKTWYSKAALSLQVKGTVKTMHPSPLVFYASVMKNAANPAAAQAFVTFLNSPQGQKIFAQYGYNPPKGKNI